MDLSRLKSRCQQGYVPSRNSKGEICFWKPFPASRGHLHSLAASQPLLYPASNVRPGPLQAVVSLPLSLLPPFSTYKDPRNYIESAWII